MDNYYNYDNYENNIFNISHKQHIVAKYQNKIQIPIPIPNQELFKILNDSYNLNMLNQNIIRGHFFTQIEQTNINTQIYDIHCYITETIEPEPFDPLNDFWPFILFVYDMEKNIVWIESHCYKINELFISYIDSRKIIYIGDNNKIRYDYESKPIFKSYKYKKNLDIYDLVNVIFNSNPQIYIRDHYLL